MMDATEAGRLKVGDRVTWNNDPDDRGEVIATGYRSLEIRWEDGLTGALHVNDCARLSNAAG